MIVRTWHGRTRAADIERYSEFTRRRAIPDYSSVEGLQRLYCLRRIEGDVAHFLLVTVWDSIGSVKEFAGDPPEKAKYYPEDDEFLLEKEENVTLYEVFAEA